MEADQWLQGCARVGEGEVYRFDGGIIGDHRETFGGYWYENYFGGDDPFINVYI